MVEKITTEDSPASGTVQRSFNVERRKAQHCLAHGSTVKMAALTSLVRKVATVYQSAMRDLATDGGC